MTKEASKKRTSDEMESSQVLPEEPGPIEPQVKKTGESISPGDFAKWSQREKWAWLFAFQFESRFAAMGFTKDEAAASEIAHNLFKVHSEYSISVPSALNRMTPEQREDFAKKRIAELREAFDWFDKL